MPYFFSQLQSIQKKNEELEGKLDKLLRVRRSPSSFSNRGISGKLVTKSKQIMIGVDHLLFGAGQVQNLKKEKKENNLFGSPNIGKNWFV